MIVPLMLQLILAPVDTTYDEDQLIRAATAGDRRAFGELYVRYARMVHGILLARVPPTAAEDLVQDVFIAAMGRLRDLRTAAAFRGWLAAIARHRAADYFRQAREVQFDDTVVREGRVEPDAFELLDLLRRLPETYRETMILRLVEGMTGPEIARLTGLTPDSVRVNLCRGMKLLRALFGKERPS
jgi:RNA polymerase sigma-70 factor, ECF subfamily